MFGLLTPGKGPVQYMEEENIYMSFWLVHCLQSNQSYLLDRLVGLQGNVRDVGVHHEREQVEDEVGRPVDDRNYQYYLNNNF